MKRFSLCLLLLIVVSYMPVHTFAQSDKVVVKSDTGSIHPYTIYNKANKAAAQIDTTFVELPDSIREKEHSPTKATLMSAALPGLGQFYNKKYWKIPIVYAGVGVLGYCIYFYANEYSTYKGAYIESVSGVTNGKHSALVKQYTADQLLTGREYYRRNLEISCIFATLWYGLNILDATVDAHLYTFNISDRLSMKVGPAMQMTGYTLHPAAGVKLSLHF